jgi:hypothetical protein
MINLKDIKKLMIRVEAEEEQEEVDFNQLTTLINGLRRIKIMMRMTFNLNNSNRDSTD